MRSTGGITATDQVPGPMRIFTLLTTLTTTLVFLFTGNAHAHLGHLGELAGHAHWIGVGAVVVAGTLAAVLASSKDTEDEVEPEEDLEPVEETA